MTSPLSRREQVILRQWGHWYLQWCLIDPEAGIRHMKGMAGGRSGFEVEGKTYWLNVTTKGLELADGYNAPAQIVLPWSRVAAHARSISVILHDRLVDHQRRNRENHDGWPTFCHDDDEETRATKDAILAGVLKRGRVLKRELEHLLDEACPLAVDSEPRDLLEMLAAMGAA